MIISNIINDSFGILSKQLRFYCWHFRRNLDQRQRQELLELLHEQHFERLANKIKSLNQGHIPDCKQQVGKLLFDHCLTRNRRNQLVQLIESGLVDIDVRLDNYGRTLLHRSAYNLDVDLVRLLIQSGINIRLRDYAGNTALHVAIQSYRNGAVMFGNGPDVVKNLTEIIQLLLEADKKLQKERCRRKKMKLSAEEENKCINGQPQKKNLKTKSKQEDQAMNVNSLVHLHHSHRLYTTKQTESSLLREQCDMNPNIDTEPHKTIDQINEQEFGQQGITLNPKSNLNSILLEDVSSPLIDTKNAFGRTALHYCVLVVGEQYLAHFIKLLTSFGADLDITDTRMKTPLYCLVKRQNISSIEQKCLAITHLLEKGCDDLGLALEPITYFNEKFIKNLEQNISSTVQVKNEHSTSEPIFNNNTFLRVPSLKHIVRLHLILYNDDDSKPKRQKRIFLSHNVPPSLGTYLNRRILDQRELF